MRRYDIYCGAICLMVNSVCVAFNPVQGWYAGGIGLVSYPPAISIDVTSPITNTQTTAKVSYIVGGGGGGQIGYRCKPWRFETEIIFNINTYSTLTVDGVTLSRENNSNSAPLTITMSGETYFIGGLFNLYYDLYQVQFSRGSRIVPYVGIGGGYVNVTNQLDLYQGGVQPVVVNGQSITSKFQKSTSAGALQFMIGTQYFGDDFTSVGFDYRYFTTFGNGNTTNNKPYVVHMGNVTLNFAFDSSSR